MQNIGHKTMILSVGTTNQLRLNLLTQESQEIEKSPNKESSKPTPSCGWYGRDTHHCQVCPAKDAACNKCNKKGTLSKCLPQFFIANKENRDFKIQDATASRTRWLINGLGLERRSNIVCAGKVTLRSPSRCKTTRLRNALFSV